MSEKMSDLVWRKEPPDCEGYWWVKDFWPKREIPIIIEVLWKTVDGRWQTSFYGLSTSNNAFRDAEWAGPIPEPKEAK